MSNSELKEKLIAAKKKLVQALGSNEKPYWANMKAWFKHQITKEEFDVASRKLLPAEDAHLHNQFFFAVLTKCQVSNASSGLAKDTQASTASHTGRKNKQLQSLKRKYDHRYIPAEPAFASRPVDVRVEPTAVPIAMEKPLPTCIKSLLIPTTEDMSSIVTVISWEMGLDEATDDSIELVTAAVRVFLKNLLTSIFLRRSAYKVRPPGKFKYAVGIEPPNPYLVKKKSVPTFPTSELRPSYEEAEQRAIEDLGWTKQNHFAAKPPASMYDLLHALQFYRHAMIASHSVLAVTCERVAMALWHPDRVQRAQDEKMKGAATRKETVT